ncbi:MAG: glycoside hydrolase family 16 protein [Cyclobacteriaceae bacterium]|nr:glycoside hydrolase family 16 protein [Cyclobacteriaceae bacterium]MCH8515139.1 glycoside hydrolase family 16 protein [Cyclobacteriaceae bacterium]
MKSGINSILIALSSFILIMSCGCSKAQDSNLIWEDNFNNGLNLENWTIDLGDGCPELCGWGNNELQTYTDNTENLRIEDGKLIIEAHSVEGKNAFSSAKILTEGKSDWTYGYFEIRAKLPSTKGTWPAIWMLPSKGKDRKWPLDGEIDIMEHVGYNPNMIYGSIHTDAYNHIKGTEKTDSIFLNDASTNFHVYALNWTEDRLQWFVNGKMYNEIIKKDTDGPSEWPFDQPYHLIINLAVGGNWGGKKGIDETSWPDQLVIDYVKVYETFPHEAH